MRLIDVDTVKERMIPLEYFSCQKWISEVELSNIPTVDAIPISAIDDIKAEIQEQTKCLYGKCVGDKCISYTDCMLQGDHIIEIIDKHIESEVE